MKTNFRSLSILIFAAMLFLAAALPSVNSQTDKRSVAVKENSVLDALFPDVSIESSLLTPLSVFVVNTPGDQNDLLPGDGVCDDGAGFCSLRGAIQEANAFAGANSIDFSIAGGCPQIINPLTPLPAITETVTINGYSQPAALPNTAPTGSNAQLCIVLDGSFAGANADGLRINAVNTTVRGLNIRDWTDAGIEIGTGNSSIVEGNFIGTDLSGTAASANRLGVFVFANNVRVGGTTLISRNIISGNTRFGIALTEPASGSIVQNNYVGLGANSLQVANGETGINVFRSASNTIGGATAAARNVISGNGTLAVGGLDGSGIYILGTVALGQAPNNVVQGNYIGTDLNGTAAIPNRANGMRIDGAINTTVGGTTVGARNVISGNTLDGIGIFGAGATGNIVQGNYIGLSADGSADLGNGQDGIEVFNVAGNTVGGTAAGSGNVVSGNGQDGVAVTGTGGDNNTVQGNITGTNAVGGAAIANGRAGINVLGGDNNIVGGTTAAERNYVAGNAGFGIAVAFGANNLVQGNYIGISSNGTTLGNPAGVFVQDSSNNTIGGTAAGAGNVVSGNGFGIRLISFGPAVTGNQIIGNLVGTNPTGTAAVANNIGILLQFAHGNTVGGTTPEARNIISGNTSSGIDILNSNNNVVLGNYIGTALDGIARIQNGGNGVNITTSQVGATANANTIGGSAAGAGNLISGNNQAGVRISAIAGTDADVNLIQGNTIGLDAAGDPEPNLVNGVTITGSTADANIVGVNVISQPTGGNVISGNTGHGVHILTAAANNGVFGNRIGTNAAGTHQRANSGNGILIDQTGFCRIGGGSPAFRNVISGNTAGGIRITGAGVTATNNAIAGNHIGSNANGDNYLLNAAGTDVASNGNYGIQIESPLNTVGGATTDLRNLISGQFVSNHAGIRVLATASNTVIRNNYIGVTANGMAFLFNGFNVEFFSPPNVMLDSNLISGAFIGVRFNGVNGGFVTNNVLGLNAAQTGVLGNGFGILLENGSSNVRIGEDSGGNSVANVIAGNNFNGITITGNTSTGNLIRQNSIYDNLRLGIDLGNDGVTQNDPGDPDLANNLQNYPVLNVVSTVIAGRLNSTPNRNFRLEFYSSPTSDPTGFGEGRSFVSQIIVTTDATGNVLFSTPNSQPLGTFISATATDLTTNDTSEFSAWRQTLAPTAVTFAGATAKTYDNGVLLEWHTGLESSNLGFRIYREKNGKRELATTDLVAGSALLTEAQLLSEQNYKWFDPSGDQNTSYYIEAVDLDGSVQLFGAINSGGACHCGRFETDGSPTLGQLGSDDNDRTNDHTIRSVQPPRKPAPQQADAQNILAESSGVKIKVNRPGFYRISLDQLFANGLPAGTNPANLRLFADGTEQPMNVLVEEGFAGIEFYGTGTETPETKTRVYYLAASDSAGMRLRKFDETRPFTGESSFMSTIQRRDRTTYFSALLNGESENFFGSVVTNTGTSQNLTVSDPAETGEYARLEVNLQGVTRNNHIVRVELNGTAIGSIVFEDMEQGSAGFDIPATQLREGANSVRLVADSPGDFSMVDYVRLTYPRRFMAVAGALALTATGEQQITIGGFSTLQVRVFDVTNPDTPFELAAKMQKSKGTDDRVYSASFSAIGAGTRKLIAVSAAEQPLAVDKNSASNLRDRRNRADLLILTRGDLADSLEPLAELRRKQGLAVQIIDTADIYDEFSFGRKSSRAIKDFLRFAAERWQRPFPRFVLLAGDATYDPNGYVFAESTDVVQTRLVDVEAMETASDDWLVDFDDDGTGELAIGRLTARDAAEMRTIVGKLLAYERQTKRNAAAFVADASDGFDFAAANARVRDIFPNSMNFTEIVREPDNTGPARAALLGAINNGQTLVAYSGHATASLWRGNLFTAADARALRNSELPVFVMMSCLNGYFVNTGTESLGEALLRNPDGGAVAVWASSATSMPDAQSELHRAFAMALTNGDTTLGEAVQNAKRGTADTTIRRSWTLFGDPTMRVR